MSTQANWLARLALDATPSLDECIAHLGANFELLYQFKATPQDAEWHAEGDVHIHTQMVLDELYQLLQTDAQHIQGSRRQALILGTLLHDIAKPWQTRPFELNGNIRIGAPQHEAIGRSYLALRIWDLALPFEVAWSVLNLVGEHHQPKFLALRAKGVADVWRVGRQADSELLYWLEVADMRGRICDDLEWQLVCLEEFKALCQTHQVWGQPSPLPSLIAPHIQNLPAAAQRYVFSHSVAALENGLVNQVEEALAKTYTQRNSYAHLVVLCGLSGSGKSTYLAQHYPDYVVVSLDELREEFNGIRSSQKQSGQIIQAAKERLKAALRQHKGVVWDATNLRLDLRDKVLDLGRDYHALTTLVVFLLPLKVIEQQNNTREHSIPSSVLQRQIEQYQFPLLSEAHEFQVIGAKGQLLYQTGVWSNSVMNINEEHL